MKRFLGTGLFVAVSIVLMAGIAFAGTAKVNNAVIGAAANVSLETLAGAQNFTFIGPAAPTLPATATDNGALTYKISQNLTSGNLVRVVLSGAAFDGSSIRVAAFNEGGGGNGYVIAEGTPAEGATTFNFQINLPAGVQILTGGNNCVWFTNAAAGNIGPLALKPDAAAANLPLQFPITASAGTATATVDIITSGGIAVDSASTATIATIAREATPTITTRLMTIDYLVTPFNGTLFTTASSGTTASNIACNVGAGFNVGWATPDFSIGAAGQNAGLTSSAVVNFDAATDWSGVTRVWLGGASSAIAANVSNVVSAPSGAVALNWATTGAGNYNQANAAEAEARLIIEVDGTTNLVSRSIVGTFGVTVAGTGSQSLAAATGTFQTWTPNGYQAYVPHMRYDPTNTLTFVRIVNNGTRDADLLGTIRQTDGTVINNADLVTNSIPAGETVTLSASAIGAANGLGTTANYALNIVGLVSADSLYSNGYFNYNSGGVWTTRDISIYDSQKTAAVVK